MQRKSNQDVHMALVIRTLERVFPNREMGGGVKAREGTGTSHGPAGNMLEARNWNAASRSLGESWA